MPFLYGEVQEPESASLRVLLSTNHRTKAIVTTSWDDGDRADLKIAELLGDRGLKGTFYIPLSSQLPSIRLTIPDLSSLSNKGFEIGGHTSSHRTLTKLKLSDIRREITTCKTALEQITGKAVSVFCYPNGRYTQEIIAEVKHAGYCGARTTRMLSCTPDFASFKMPVTLQAFPHSQRAYLKNVLRAPSAGRWRLYVAHARRCSGWVELAKRLFDQVLSRGGVWHLYGHSWEIESLQLWSELREVLDHVHGREDVMYVSNGELLSLARLRSRYGY